MADVTLHSLVFSTECEFRYGGSIAHSVFSSAPLSASVHRTVELHEDKVLYFFEEPHKSMAKHLREKVYVEGCRCVDCGEAQGKECLALFLQGHDYGERTDEFGNRVEHLFVQHTGGSGHQHSGTSERATWRDDTKGFYMALLYVLDKTAKWHLLKALQRLSGEYAALFPADASSPAVASALLASPLQTESSRSEGVLSPPNPGSATAVRNRFDEVIGGSSDTRHPYSSRRQDEGYCRSSSSDSSATVLSDHEVLQLDDVLKSYEEKSQAEAPRVGAPPSHRAADEDEELPLPVDGCSAADDDSALHGQSSSVSDSTCPWRLTRSPLFRRCVDGVPENQRCADCSEPHPTWCVLQPFGCFVCINCVGVHRKLWANRCREAELDKWPDADISFMQSRGNAAVNAELEYCLRFPRGCIEASLGQVPVKPQGRHAPPAQRTAFIHQKYEEKLFTSAAHPEGADNGSSSTAGTAGKSSPLALRDATSSLPSSFTVSNPFNASASPLGVLPPELIGTHASPAVDHLDEGPPQYSGLVDVFVKELVTRGESFPGAICVITNGFQALRTKGGRKLVNMASSTTWDEHLQVGAESAQSLLFCSVHSAKAELLAAGEFRLPDAVSAGEAAMFAVELPWCELQRRAPQRHRDAPWQVTMLVSYRSLT